jgi:hypothetical protein
LTGEERFERGQARLALLALGRQSSANAGAGIRSPVATEAAGDLLLRLKSAQVALRLIVHDV